MELTYINDPLPRIKKGQFVVVLLITLGATFTFREYPIQFLGVISAILFLSGVYHIPELGIGVLANGLYLVGYFWRGFEITFLITPLAVAICSAGLAHYALNHGFRWRFGVLPGVVLLIALLLLIGTLYSSLPGTGLIKTGRYLFLNVFIFFSTLLFTGNLGKLKNLLKVIAFSGIVLSVISAIYAALLGVESISRFTLPGQNPIWLARGIGMSLLATLFWMDIIQKRVQKFVFLVFILLMLSLIYSTASRGPFLSLLLVLFLYLIILKGGRFKLAKGMSFFLLLLFSVRFLIAFAPGQIWSRMLGLFSRFDTTTFARLQAFETARDLFIGNPLTGVGTGGFGQFSLMKYPHNISLELASELGILGVLLLLIMVSYATYLGIKLLRRKEASPLEHNLSRVFFAIFIFALINSQISGEISSNYELWFAAAGIWALYAGRRKIPKTL